MITATAEDFLEAINQLFDYIKKWYFKK